MNIDQKIAENLKKMTLEEKASLCSGKDFWHLEGIKRLGIPSIMVTDGPHGLRKQAGEGDHVGIGNSVPATCFPTAVTLASSWDRELIGQVGEALGDECRQEKVSVLLGPGVNIKRNPLCGRNFEYFSEDPYISGELASAFINGVQSKGIGVSLKHFAANNQEFFRMSIDTIVDERTLRELYLRSFEKAVKQSQPWTVMNAYNRLNGDYCSENKTLLKDILKEEWGHTGLVVTDWGATNNRVKGLQSGLELEMPGSQGLNDKKIVVAVQDGSLDESVLDERVGRLLNLIFKSQETLENTYSYDKKDHHKLAKKVASESIVLLKNENKLLPLSKKGKIAVIGDFAENPRFQGAGSSQINPTQLDSALESLRSQAGDSLEIAYARGFDTKKDIIDNSLIEEALSITEGADHTLIFAGLPPSFESEGFDRVHMRLPENQLVLINKILDKKPDTVIILSNGSPVEMPFINKCNALIESYLCGQAGGSAIIDILFGDVVPSGKLAETFPVKLEDVPSFGYFPGTTKQVQYREGLFVGYRYFDSKEKDVLFPFGHGLSYSEFMYSDMRISNNNITCGDILTVNFKVKNTGKFDAKEIIQLYVHDVKSSVYRPFKELKEFEKIHLSAGEEKHLTFTLDDSCFSFYDTASAQWQIESGDFEILIGSSSRDIRLSHKVNITSAFIPVKNESDDIYASLEDIHTIDDSSFQLLLGREIPAAAPLRPFHSNSTIADISTTFIGRVVRKEIRKHFIKVFGEADESMILMFNSMVNEMPLRNLVSMGGDDFSESKLKGLLLMLNGRFFKGLSLFRKK